ncbi:hypothetical protein [Rhodoligotrophos ferricapiens]|uniref:hypothetical protein n=1 Tax=Rhodoligotrophos ferricapiens TaxID=3069264 RepID=UPI00315C8A80
MSLAEATHAHIVSKGEFARLSNVTPGRVSQWIAEGKIHGPALVGDGRMARINVAIAQAQLRGNLDIGQRLGNGIETRLDTCLDAHPGATDGGAARSPGASSASSPTAPAASPVWTPPAPAVDAFEDRLRREKIRELEFRNRAAAEQELARRGIYVRSDQAGMAMRNALREMLTVCEGALSDLASAIAAKFEVPQRDVLHLMKTEFRAVRQRASEAAAARAKAMPSIIPDIQDDTEDLPA